MQTELVVYFHLTCTLKFFDSNSSASCNVHDHFHFTLHTTSMYTAKSFLYSASITSKVFSFAPANFQGSPPVLVGKCFCQAYLLEKYFPIYANYLSSVQFSSKNVLSTHCTLMSGYSPPKLAFRNA